MRQKTEHKEDEEKEVERSGKPASQLEVVIRDNSGVSKSGSAEKPKGVAADS